MLVFRKGVWREIELPFSDPMMSEANRKYAAAIIANYRESSLKMAITIAETDYYSRMFPLRVSWKEHNAPQNKEKQAGMKKESKGCRASS
jgi:hypothetical protein